MDNRLGKCRNKNSSVANSNCQWLIIIQANTTQELYADFDSNGWPQKGRNKALRIIRKSFSPTITGDTHLGAVSVMGVENWEIRDTILQHQLLQIIGYAGGIRKILEKTERKTPLAILESI